MCRSVRLLSSTHLRHRTRGLKSCRDMRHVCWSSFVEQGKGGGEFEGQRWSCDKSTAFLSQDHWARLQYRQVWLVLGGGGGFWLSKYAMSEFCDLQREKQKRHQEHQAREEAAQVSTNLMCCDLIVYCNFFPLPLAWLW